MDNKEPNIEIKQGLVSFDPEAKKTPEEKMYLVLLKGEYEDNENKEFRDFEFIVGRKKAYMYIRDFIENNEDGICISLFNSIILHDKCYITEFVSIYEFMKAFQTIYEDEGFNIDDYVVDGGYDGE